MFEYRRPQRFLRLKLNSKLISCCTIAWPRIILDMISTGAMDNFVTISAWHFLKLVRKDGWIYLLIVCCKKIWKTVFSAKLWENFHLQQDVCRGAAGDNQWLPSTVLSKLSQMCCNEPFAGLKLKLDYLTMCSKSEKGLSLICCNFSSFVWSINKLAFHFQFGDFDLKKYPL